MVTRTVVTDPLISHRAADALRKFGKARLKPSLTLSVVAAGGTFLWIRASWTTALADGSLAVRLDAQTDVTARLSFDPDTMTATGTVEAGGVGLHTVTATGEFLASLAPLRTVRLAATAEAYLPY